LIIREEMIAPEIKEEKCQNFPFSVYFL
jgi:hypothetical protein